MSGTVSVNAVQLGESVTASQNFVLQTNVDGTAKLSRGNVGATIQDILTIDAAGKITFPLPPIQTQYSEVRLTLSNGYASTNTMIRRLLNLVTNTGNDITYADSATLGPTFTINTDGLYTITYRESFNAAGGAIGLSLNSTQLTTVIQSITAADVIGYIYVDSANSPEMLTVTKRFAAGSVIRPHTNGTASGSGGNVPIEFTIARVA